MSDKDHPYESCENCKFFLENEWSKKIANGDENAIKAFLKREAENIEHFKRFGVCRRHPPALEVVRGERHPAAFVNDWCGEWK